jgi:hypothetical protein
LFTPNPSEDSISLKTLLPNIPSIGHSISPSLLVILPNLDTFGMHIDILRGMLRIKRMTLDTL